MISWEVTGGTFSYHLALGSILGALVGYLATLDLLRSKVPYFAILGMSGYFGEDSKVTLTAMALATLKWSRHPQSQAFRYGDI